MSPGKISIESRLLIKALVKSLTDISSDFIGIGMDSLAIKLFSTIRGLRKGTTTKIGHQKAKFLSDSYGFLKETESILQKFRMLQSKPTVVKMSNKFVDKKSLPEFQKRLNPEDKSLFGVSSKGLIKDRINGARGIFAIAASYSIFSLTPDIWIIAALSAFATAALIDAWAIRYRLNTHQYGTNSMEVVETLDYLLSQEKDAGGGGPKFRRQYDTDAAQARAARQAGETTPEGAVI